MFVGYWYCHLCKLLPLILFQNSDCPLNGQPDQGLPRQRRPASSRLVRHRQQRLGQICLAVIYDRRNRRPGAGNGRAMVQDKPRALPSQPLQVREVRGIYASSACNAPAISIPFESLQIPYAEAA